MLKILIKNLRKINSFILKKNYHLKNMVKLDYWEKSVITEQKITRIYPHENLFSHVLGQIDDENNGISGLEKSLDATLKNQIKKYN